ncbi:gamma-butyrobetaine hydroxylase-like domain-containing protein [Massilia aerilata]|uniref:Gamma-butyrobetaine hydroxylase-like domain-containing protein n=1 Tax=Massilia aerilata TaxID=453817 RepID=A0ABW0S023_9BURK
MPTPTKLTIRQQSRILEISFDDGTAFAIPFELMRVYSPSAEVKGHGPGQEVLQVGKREVGIKGVEPVGNYAIKPLFTDGHESGIYTWDYLYKLGKEEQALWQDYLQRLHADGFAGDSGREPGSVLPGAPAKAASGCGHHH